MSLNANTSGLGLLRQPKMTLFGPGQRRQLPQIIEPIARKLLITTDRRMAGTPEFIAVKDAIAARGVEILIYADVEPDLPRSNVLDIVATFGNAGVDAVLGIGGGSCLDAAKVAAAVLANGGDIRDYFGEFRVPKPGLPVITVPTTGGTGAEVTCISVVYDDEARMKVGVASPHLQPFAAVIDPELTLSCPPGLTAATGADALSHLIEAFTARAKNPTADEIARHLYVGKNLLADLFAANGLRLLGKGLERVVADPSDLQARSDVMMAAFNAGVAINTTGTAGVHAIQSPIGALTHTPHGFGVAALLPYVMRFNLRVRVAEFAEIGRILEVADASAPAEEQARAGIRRVEEMLRMVGAPTNLADLGLEPSQFEFVAEQAMKATRLTANNPRELTRDNIVGILRKGYEADLGWWDIP